MRRLSPVTLDILCFRYDPGGLDTTALAALNAEIMMRLQEQGVAAFSDTWVHGERGPQAALCHHRTTDADLDLAMARFCAWARRWRDAGTPARPRTGNTAAGR